MKDDILEQLTKNLEQTLNKLTGFYAISTKVIFKNEVDGEKTKNINIALDRCNENERIDITMGLFRLWIYGTIEQIEKIMGNFNESKRKYPMLTLTSDSKQLKVWHDFYSGFESQHEADTEKGLLCIIEGCELAVSNYLNAFLEIRKFTELKAENGNRLFLFNF